MVRFRHDQFDVRDLVEAKGAATVTVLIPARDEARTIGRIVHCVRRDLGTHGGAGLVDDLVVVDDASSDDTAALAAAAGAEVLAGPGVGKGGAMRLARGRGDIVVFLDGDVVNFAPHFVTGTLGPLLTCSEAMLVKGAYVREPAPHAAPVAGGGRVTELVAKPLLSLLFPELCGLAEMVQPLAGETAVRSEILEATRLEPDYGVEIGLLIDVARSYGTSAIAEVDLGVRQHRNRPLHELSHQARQVMAAMLSRAAVAA